MEDFSLTNHEDLLRDLTDKIRPENGRLTYFSSNAEGYKHYQAFGVAFGVGDFNYHDSFYGDTSTRNMEMELSLEYVSKLRLTNIYDLEGKSFENAADNLFAGSFSNSLDIILLSYGFGEIKGGYIHFTMKYFFTGSDSYGYMTGNWEEHSKFVHELSLPLKVEMIFEDVIGCGKEALNGFIPPEIYDLENIRLSPSGFIQNNIKGERYRVNLK